MKILTPVPPKSVENGKLSHPPSGRPMRQPAELVKDQPNVRKLKIISLDLKKTPFGSIA